LYLDDVGTAYVYLLSPCGGVVGGDVYSMTVVVEAGARACLTTPSATKLYATSGAPAQQRLDITLQADAVLEYLPEQMIPFAQAVFHQQITVRLGAGACVMLMEIVAPGRVARGEAFAYGEYDTRVSIEKASGRALVRERTRLRPGWQQLDGPGLFEAITISVRSMPWSKGQFCPRLWWSVYTLCWYVVEGSWGVPRSSHMAA